MSEVKRLCDSYIEVDGELYEKIQTKTETIELDLAPDIAEFVEKECKKGHFVNKQEFIRHALRQFVQETPQEGKQLLVEPVLHDGVSTEEKKKCENKCDSCECDDKLLTE
jgi:Arc/MetJ-type ribon-helix-helix transcriptional regulator